MCKNGKQQDKTKEQKHENRNSYEFSDVLLSVILVILIIGVLSYFTG